MTTDTDRVDYQLFQRLRESLRSASIAVSRVVTCLNKHDADDPACQALQETLQTVENGLERMILDLDQRDDDARVALLRIHDPEIEAVD